MPDVTPDPRPERSSGGMGRPKREKAVAAPRKPIRRIDPMEVKKLYEEGLSQPQIAEVLGFNSGTVCRAMQRIGLQARDARDYYEIPEIDVVRRLYVDEGLGMQEISYRLGCGLVTVKRLLVEARVEIRPFHRPPGISAKAKPRYGTALKKMRAPVAERSRGRCEVGIPGCLGQASAIHHRKLRSQGGSNELENLLHVCLYCHGKIHADVAVAYENGWLVRSTDDPAEIIATAARVRFT